MHAVAAVAVAGIHLALPAGWHGAPLHPQLATCDPASLAVAGNYAPALTSHGWALPRRGHVLVFLEEDHVNKPLGNLRRPVRFHLPWGRFSRVEGCCGLPSAPGAMVWFRTKRRYLGFIVYAGPGVSARTRAQTERVLDSLRVR